MSATTHVFHNAIQHELAIKVVGNLAPVSEKMHTDNLLSIARDGPSHGRGFRLSNELLDVAVQGFGDAMPP